MTVSNNLWITEVTTTTKRWTVASGLRNFALFTDCANCSLFNFAMTRDTGDLALRWVQPYRVPSTFTIRHTALFAQISLQVDALHASVSSMTSRTASGERFFSDRSRWHSRTSFNASSRFALASGSVSPWEIAAGISSTKHVYPPSFAGSKTAVNFIWLDYHMGVPRQSVTTSSVYDREPVYDRQI